MFVPFVLACWLPIFGCANVHGGASGTLTETTLTTLSGYVYDAQGTPLPGVRIGLDDADVAALTDETGRYTLAVPQVTSGVLRPTLPGYRFAPTAWSFTHVMRDVPSIDFRGITTPDTLTISGHVYTEHQTPAVGVMLRATGVADELITDSGGLYVLQVETGWSGIIEAGAPGIALSPAERLFKDISRDFENQDFVASLIGDADLDTLATDQGAAPDSVDSSYTSTPIPLAEPQLVRVDVGTPKFIVLTGKDAQGFSALTPLGRPLTFRIQQQPTHGTLHGAPPVLTYLPDDTYRGTDEFTFTVCDGETVSAPATVTLQVRPWAAPIGIPRPPFGLSATAGPATYYIDQHHPEATDDDNPRGSAERPRVTIPTTLHLVPGDVVEIAPGDYTQTPNELRIFGGGTANNPAFVRGASILTRPAFDKRISLLHVAGYIVFENLTLTTAPDMSAGMEVVGTAHDVAIRNCEMVGITASPIRIFGSEPPGAARILVYNNLIHANGDWLTDYDQDYHGVAVGRYASHIWIVDNEFYHNSGNGVQVNASHKDYEDTTHHIYIGRNRAHHNKQSGLWTKYADHVIFSQNTCFAARPVYPNSSSEGEGIGGQYGPAHVWILHNDIYDCANGIRFSSDAGGGGIGQGQDIYIIGNRIHNIHHSDLDVTGKYPVAYDPANPWSPGKAVAIWHASATKHIVNNTIHDVDGGIFVTRQKNAVRIVNNIFGTVDDHLPGDGDLHIRIEQTTSAEASGVFNNVFDGDARIRWGGDTMIYTVVGFEQSYPLCGADNVVGDPRFVNPDAIDFRLLADSAAIDRGQTHEAFQIFFDLYRLDINVDLDGLPRPQDGDGDGSAEWDIGAYEYPAH